MTSLHNHCTFCDGKSTLEEMTAAAKRAGITTLGISCHSDDPTPFSTNGREDAYFTLVRAAQKTSPVTLLLGVEEDFFFPVSRRVEYDYVIGSVHYVSDNDGKLHVVDNAASELKDGIDALGSPLKYAERYFEHLVGAAKRKPDILGHFDIFRKRASGVAEFSGKAYRDLALSALDECLKHGVVFEVNYGGVLKGYVTEPYPERFILERIREKGGLVTVTTDCHDANFIDFGLKEGQKLLKSVGFECVVAHKDGKLTEVEI